MTLSVVHDRDAVAELLGFLDVVGREQDGLLFLLEFLDNVVDFAADLRVESGRRFIEKHDARIVHQRHGQRQALLLAAGELGVERIFLFFESESREQLGRAPAAGVEAAEEVQGFANAHLVGQRGGLQRRADDELKLVARPVAGPGRRR
jgi:hypothetical protein